MSSDAVGSSQAAVGSANRAVGAGPVPVLINFNLTVLDNTVCRVVFIRRMNFSLSIADQTIISLEARTKKYLKPSDFIDSVSFIVSQEQIVQVVKPIAVQSDYGTT